MSKQQLQSEAFNWHSHAAGHGVPQNIAEGIRWCRRAAEQVHVDVQYAVAQGDLQAQVNLGFFYPTGRESGGGRP